MAPPLDSAGTGEEKPQTQQATQGWRPAWHCKSRRSGQQQQRHHVQHEACALSQASTAAHVCQRLWEVWVVLHPLAAQAVQRGLLLLWGPRRPQPHSPVVHRGNDAVGWRGRHRRGRQPGDGQGTRCCRGGLLAAAGSEKGDCSDCSRGVESSARSSGRRRRCRSSARQEGCSAHLPPPCASAADDPGTSGGAEATRGVAEVAASAASALGSTSGSSIAYNGVSLRCSGVQTFLVASTKALHSAWWPLVLQLQASVSPRS